MTAKLGNVIDNWRVIDVPGHFGGVMVRWRHNGEERSLDCEELADRIVACYNACRGFDTLMLQSLRHPLSTLHERHLLLLKEHEELLAKLRAAGERSTTYDHKAIARELEETAMGVAYHGNALRAAKDLAFLESADRALLDRWASGLQGTGDHVALQRLALRIHEATA